jgi:anti-sigma regulatory factor (Ser/Thr protein kinase)
MLYDGWSDFFRQTLPFIRDGITSRQPILIVVEQRKIRELRRLLGADAANVRFQDMTTIGRNPARIIPVWRAFVDERWGTGVARAIGEPVWAGRSPDELIECERHEVLVNLAFSGPSSPLRLVCPYDTGALAMSVIDEARRNHPIITSNGASRRNATYLKPDASAIPSQTPLPSPPKETTATMPFDEDHLHELREFVRRQGMGRGVGPERIPDLVQAVNEAVTNSIRYGGGGGALQIWSQDAEVVCDVSDRGVIKEPLVGRIIPDPTEPGGFGLWLANQLCDLVQVRTSPAGSSVRLHIDIA